MRWILTVNEFECYNVPEKKKKKKKKKRERKKNMSKNIYKQKSK